MSIPDVSIGDVLQDNDKRMRGRCVVVREIKDGYAYCVNAHGSERPIVRIRLDRITDHFRSTGFTRIRCANVRVCPTCGKPA